MAQVLLSPYRTLSIKDLQDFYCCGRTTAFDRKKELSSYFGRQNVRVCDLAKYESLPVSSLLDFFNC